ncbi:MAG: glycine cleavage system protein H, glycine cleavage system H protein [Candidatus Peregrinibacteria bacterium GW2011_GWF2_33_10]|nr:MAG: glycine cleavage system protein H, glycine cleavage system H protein [Candidatus Peregrinibacteria bacterium GW2011_GWF2_33_10]OGJ45165.1 MAG: glycine cleavage system protein H [Candidatus Peregrinibacteria bacterium RIFOXYA12_FULL_33_12]OGJ45480.1 MAG: glycine cleavage system protein H [Candidatus Peregrinibacteria bacterium RIFOXYA2_FULL_33_21]OGJ51191.1 MAG: glycine cleavage system protein H [Candidatus Peregrinibacteria bacterium RIFOXYB2_FULL_33_20]
MKNYNIQDALFYTKEHEWVKIDGSHATVGVSDYAQDLLTDVVFVELPNVGKEVKQFGQACVVESVKSVSDVYSPVSGKVTEINKDLESAPELINNDPYGKGWIYKLEGVNESEKSNLMDATKYKEFIAGLAH